MVRGGLVATAALLLGMGLLQGFTGWGVLRTAAGVMSAWTFVFASGWGLRRLAETGAPALAGVIYTGPGIGIAVTGLLGGAVGRWGSEAGWIGFGLAGAGADRRDLAHLRRRRAAMPQRRRPRAAAAPSAAESADRAPRCALAGRALRPGGLRLHHHGDLPAGDRAPGAAGLALARPVLAAVRPGDRAGRADRRARAGRTGTTGCCWRWPTRCRRSAWCCRWPGRRSPASRSAACCWACRSPRSRCSRCGRRGACAAMRRPGLIGYATASYGVGQILGPLFAAPLAQRTGSFAVPLLVAAAALALGAVLFAGSGGARSGPAGAFARVETPALLTHLAYNSRLTTKRAGTNRPFFIGRSILDARPGRGGGIGQQHQRRIQTRGIAADSGTNRGRSRLRPGRDRTLGRGIAARHD